MNILNNIRLIRRLLFLFFVLYIVTLIFLNFVGYWNNPPKFKKIPENILSNRTQVIGEVVSWPQLSKDRIKFFVKLQNSVVIFVDCYVNQSEDITYGNMVNLRGTIKTFDPIAKYSSYYKYRDVYYYMKEYTINSYSYLGRGSIWRYYFQRFRSSFVKRISIINKGKARAFLPAIIIGDKNYLSKEDSEFLRSNGLSHIISISGMHVGIIFLFITFFFKNKKSILFLIIVIISIWLYAGITGFSPSCVRASLMLSLMTLCNLFDRDSFSVNNLIITALVMLVISPKQLFLVGFQFSFLGVFGIIYFYPFWKRIFDPIMIPNIVKDIFNISLSAQTALVPLILFYFGKINFLSLFLNLIFVPFLGIIMGIGIISAAISYLFLNIATYIAQINFFIIEAIFKAGYFLSNRFSLVVSNDPGDIVFVAIYYFVFLTFPILTLIKQKRRYFNLYLMGVFLVLVNYFVRF